MRNFTKLMLIGTMLFTCLGGAKAKLSLDLPGVWSGTTKDGSNLTAKCTVTVKANTPVSDPVEDFVTRLYRLCLNRQPDSAGLKSWTDQLKSGKISAADAVYGFFLSAEMQGLNLSDDEFINRCYRVMMNREADKGGKDYWKQVLSEQMKKDVLNGFIGSNEFSKICASYNITRGEHKEPTGIDGFIARCYNKALRRDYDTSGLEYWRNQIYNNSNFGPTTKERAITVASAGFFNSQEFLSKNLSNELYVKTLYRTFLGREADPNGIKDWLSQMNNGATRDYILKGFAYSQEFTEILKSYGIE